MALGAYAQGLITGNTAGTPALVSTNGSSVGQGTGLTSPGPGSNPVYEFAVLTGASSISGAQNNPFNGLWTWTGVYGTNNSLVSQAGGMKDNGAATGWAAGASNAFMVVAWSTTLGFDWTTVSAQLSNVFNTGGLGTGGRALSVTGSNPYGWLGLSDVGWLISGGAGTPAAPPNNIFGTVNPAGQPINTPTTLLPVSAVPEPTTFALFGLGAAGLLIFRRRKN